MTSVLVEQESVSNIIIIQQSTSSQNQVDLQLASPVPQPPPALSQVQAKATDAAENGPPAKRLRQTRLTVPRKILQKTGQEALLDMIVIDCQPFQIVENERFRMYTKVLNADLELPSRKKITEMLEEKYKIQSKDLKKKMEDVDYIALTSDGWSSDSIKSFMSVTAHLIEGGTLKSLVISTAEITDSHAAQNIANAIQQILDEWKICEKVVRMRRQ